MDTVSLIDAANPNESQIVQKVKTIKLQVAAKQAQETLKQNQNTLKTLKNELQQTVVNINAAEAQCIGLKHIINEMIPRNYDKFLLKNAEIEKKCDQLQKQFTATISSKSQIQKLSAEKNDLNAQIAIEEADTKKILSKIADAEKILHEATNKNVNDLETAQIHWDKEAKRTKLQENELMMISNEIEELENEYSLIQQEIEALACDAIKIENNLKDVGTASELLSNKLEGLVNDSSLQEKKSLYKEYDGEFKENEILLSNQSQQIAILDKDVQATKDEVFLQVNNICQEFHVDLKHSKEDFCTNCTLTSEEISQCIAENIKHTEQEINSIELKDKEMDRQNEECVKTIASIKTEIEMLDRNINEFESKIVDNTLQNEKLAEMQLLIDEQESHMCKLDSEIADLPGDHDTIEQSLLEAISLKREEVHVSQNMLDKTKRNFWEKTAIIDENITVFQKKIVNAEAAHTKIKQYYDRLLTAYKKNNSLEKQFGNAEKKVSFSTVVTEREITIDSEQSDSTAKGIIKKY